MRNVTLLVGGQYGSEGKGKFAAYLAPEFDVAVRVGGANAGHTVVFNDKEYKFRQLPVGGLLNPDCTLCIGAGGLISLNVLREELDWIPGVRERLVIDRNAGIVEDVDMLLEGVRLFEAIGSTAKGVGSSLSRKVSRQNYRTAKDVPELAGYINNVQKFLLGHTGKIIIEGTQGYALSLNHGPYPFCTSRDVLATSLLSDVGLPCDVVEDIIMVVRTYPIRVFGNSGPMYNEITWDEVTKLSHSPIPLLERTTVTNRVRRVGTFDKEIFKEASEANHPTQIALSFVDYIDYENFGVVQYDDLTLSAKLFIGELGSMAHTPVTLISTGPKTESIIDRRIK